MKLILRNSNDPYFNIAAEEYFIKNSSDDILMLWQSSPSVIVGKHQNTISEVNLKYTSDNNIPVIRRISGGGTVYHDEGNINYTVISSSKKKEQLVNFQKFTTPLIGFLTTIGLKAVFEGKNNLTIDGNKFSGNSAHVYKNKILHHGTILFNTNLDNLEMAIKSGDINISDKAVKSIRAHVINLNNLLPKINSTTEFLDKLTNYLKLYYDIRTVISLSVDDITNITKLVETKYKNWNWNYGYSPSYKYEKELSGTKLSMEINKGIIINITVDGDKAKNIKKTIGKLINQAFNNIEIEKEISSGTLTPDNRTLILSLLGIG